MTKKIGIVGYGFLGSYLFDKIQDETGLSVGFVRDANKNKCSDLDTSLVVDSIEEGLQRKPDLIVELVGWEWVEKNAPLVLESSDLLIASVAAFAKEGLQEKLDVIAKANRTRYFISHGGIIGLDGIKDGKEVIEGVKVSTIRPQKGYAPDVIKEKIIEKSIIYDGPAREACQMFPRNVNLFATVALHGIGFDRTQCRIVVDPHMPIMKHLIEVSGPGLTWNLEIHAIPFGNKSKVFVPESFFQTVKRICDQDCGLKLI